MFESRQEKRRVSEAMDAVLCPLMQYLDKDMAALVKRGLEILRETEVKDNADSD